MIRKEVLEEAIAGLWNSYVKSACVGGGDVAIMMALFKIGRMITSADQKRDTFVDAAGYIACAAQILLPKEEEGEKR